MTTPPRTTARGVGRSSFQARISHMPVPGGGAAASG
jgi:hypothetical protein